jgi:DNA ligase 1
MSKVIKPLLATKAEFDKIQYPVLATPKLDGIRCLMVDGVAMSRSMKPIPNSFIQDELSGYDEMDGELMLNGDYNAVQSGIMSRDGEPDFTYYVFDYYGSDDTYRNRIREISIMAHETDIRISILTPIKINTEDELESYMDKCIAEGYEGVMIRDPNGKYKHGRSTVKEGILLKIKRFLDDEAILVGVTEKMHNGNILEQDELGNAKRSSHKENLTPAGTAGSCILRWNGIEFRVGFGPGWTDERKLNFWERRDLWIGLRFTFRYQELSKDGVPRFGKLVGIRHEDDLS